MCSLPKFWFAKDNIYLPALHSFYSFSDEKWYETLFDKQMLKNPAYYLLIISQCANAIGFLNLTTFLNVHLAQRMKYDSWNIVWTLSIIQGL